MTAALIVEQGRRFDLGQVLLAAAVGFAAGFPIIAAYWARWVRLLAIGSDWVAWKPRWARRWRVLSFSRLASIAPGIDVSTDGLRRHRGTWSVLRDYVTFGLAGTASADVAVRWPDGRGIRLRPYELAGGVGRALLKVAGDNPAMTDLARQQLDRYARVSFRVRSRGRGRT